MLKFFSARDDENESLLGAITEGKTCSERGGDTGSFPLPITAYAVQEDGLCLSQKTLIQHLAARTVRILCVRRTFRLHLKYSVNATPVKCPASSDVTGCGLTVALAASVPASGLNICTCVECVTVPGSARAQPDRCSPAPFRKPLCSPQQHDTARLHVN